MYIHVHVLGTSSSTCTIYSTVTYYTELHVCAMYYCLYKTQYGC